MLLTAPLPSRSLTKYTQSSAPYIGHESMPVKLVTSRKVRDATSMIVTSLAAEPR
jgi:hypothetical protein